MFLRFSPMFKSPLFYINLVLLVMIVSLALSVNVSNSHLPNFLKKAIAQVQSITGSGTPNYLAVFGQTSPSYTIGNSIIYDNGTNVGIGTTNPNQYAKLDVAGPIRVNSIGIMGGEGSGAVYFPNSGNFYLRSADLTNNPGTNNTERLFISGNTGNVGINTTSPSQKLEVAGIGKFGRLYVGDSQYGTYSPGIGTDGNVIGTLSNGGLYVMNGNNSAYNNVYAQDYWINSVGKWASQMSKSFQTRTLLASQVYNGDGTRPTVYSSTASADGFVTASLDTSSGGTRPHCGLEIWASGAKITQNNINGNGVESESVTAPIKNGESYTIALGIDRGPCYVWAYWMPLQ